MRAAWNASAINEPQDPFLSTSDRKDHMLAHELAAAEACARRALAIDGGSSWGWGRLAWVHCYRGETDKAIECCGTTCARLLVMAVVGRGDRREFSLPWPGGSLGAFSVLQETVREIRSKESARDSAAL
jgi:hypothetical protein